MHPELTPTLTTDELVTKIEAVADEAIKQAEIEHAGSADDTAVQSLLSNIKDNPPTETPYPLSCELHLSDNLIYNWDKIPTDRSRSPRNILAAKAKQKFVGAVAHEIKAEFET